jgi:membrane protein DedA with SNARE-associated domain
MQALLAGIVDFVSAHRAWAPALVFLLALGETTAFVSILIPSTAILVGIGALVAAGGLDFAPVWTAAALGALVGSTLSYWLGGRFGPRMLGLWPLNRDPALVARGTSAFARWGAATVLAGHFIGPLRSVVFLVAGVSAMRMIAFQVANVPGALVWAYVVPKSGELGGSAIGAVWRGLFGA